MDVWIWKEPGKALWGWGRLRAEAGSRRNRVLRCRHVHPEPQHLPLMKHFITAPCQGGHPIPGDKFPATALASLAAAVILLHLE